LDGAAHAAEAVGIVGKGGEVAGDLVVGDAAEVFTAPQFPSGRSPRTSWERSSIACTPARNAPPPFPWMTGPP
jgi:hypothetical protein